MDEARRRMLLLFGGDPQLQKMLAAYDHARFRDNGGDRRMMTIADAVGAIEDVFQEALSVEQRERVGRIIDGYARGQDPRSFSAHDHLARSDGTRAFNSETERREVSWEQAESRLAPVPFKPGESYVPDYYRLWVEALDWEMVDDKTMRVEVDAIEILGAAAEGRHPFVSFALKYLLRAGRKPGESEIKDVYKAMEWLQRLLPKETSE